MDRAEALVFEHLKSRGYGDIVHEPDGNVPPDFLLDRHVAVEVRRLNENEQGLERPRGLAEVEIPLLEAVQRLLNTYGRPQPNTWLVVLRFKRPVPKWREIERPVRAFLDQVAKTSPPARQRTVFHDTVELEVVPASTPLAERFHLAMSSDGDSGGWLLDLLTRNLRLCIQDKSAKVAPVRHKYPEWWLILVDEIAFGLSDVERDLFRERPSISHDWDKVVLVSATDHTRFFEL